MRRMTNRLHLFRNSENEKFLDGIEGIDFTTDEQISFLYDHYIQLVLNSK